MTTSSLNYRAAGVDIDAGNTLVEKIKPHAKKTQRPEVLTGLGGFGALFELDTQRYQQPVLVSATDGVGTKLKLALQLQQHDHIGIDLVAMCVNDLVTCGAEPLFFLDYYATGQLDVSMAETVIKGIAAGCEQAGCALVGGETAEMPGMYQDSEYDLAGFCVGVVEKTKLITPELTQAGDILIGLPSSGPHSNGYSLIRKVIEHANADLQQACGDTTLANAVMAPTRIYVKALLNLLQTCPVHGMAHITGGGFIENIPRMLAPNLFAEIHRDSWEWPAIFHWLQQAGQIDTTEMLRTFNCGIGMVIAVAASDKDRALKSLQQSGEAPVILGQLNVSDDANPSVVLA